jgi:hypothetical protein
LCREQVRPCRIGKNRAVSQNVLLLSSEYENGKPQEVNVNNMFQTKTAIENFQIEPNTEREIHHKRAYKNKKSAPKQFPQTRQPRQRQIPFHNRLNAL